jgi:3-oxoacyl-[acyl-carrier-protein] synthase-1
VLEALQGSWVPASVGAQPADPELGLNVPSEAVDLELRFALCNAFAFGGSNVSLLFEAPQ